MGAVRIINSDIVTCFNSAAIGTKVTDHEAFKEVMARAVAAHDFETGTVPGQGFILCPEAIPFVSAGVGRRTTDPVDYINRLHRGRVGMYLKREKAAAVEGCALVIDTRAAYLADPDIDPVAMAKRFPDDPAKVAEAMERTRQIQESDCTHVLVTVLAFAGPKSPLPPDTFCRNLAGANNEALVWDGDKIRAVAKEVMGYWDVWSVVAD